MSTITRLDAREILDSRGNPTLEVTVETENGGGMCGVPSGASTGEHEAQELRDGGDRFGGQGVRKAVDVVRNDLSSVLVGVDASDQEAVDRALIDADGTPTKERFGGNAIIGVSIATARATAHEKGITLKEYLQQISGSAMNDVPRICANVLNGGKHAGSGLAFQEFMVVPDSETVSEGIETVFAIQHTLKDLIGKQYVPSATGIGDEGGFAPPVPDVRTACALVEEAIGSYSARLALDVAASSFYHDGSYEVNGEMISADALTDVYRQLTTTHDIAFIEDPFDEHDYDAHAQLRRDITTPIIGDDITVTNAGQLAKAYQAEAVDGLIIKPNQVGTLTETIEAVRYARDNALLCIGSHRSGETNDDWIVDIASGLGCWGIKLGALQRGERIAKYNRLQQLYGI